MRRMIAASVARRIALKKLGADALALAAQPPVQQAAGTVSQLSAGHKKRRDGARR
ncbi:hypothetical protein [Janthinobacterium sp. RB2R34]|uniref:hypothetical protein n=1 Tax=Janthinobacterium sp. RB2R34 TaxID=3424193 RepID=UPI003F28E69A